VPELDLVLEATHTRLCKFSPIEEELDDFLI
jgi:hypothetical protein